MTRTLTLAELKARRETNPRLICLEALPEKYYRDWHLPGAKHMPHTLVDELAPQMLTDKTAEIVVYCASDTCANSHQAAQQLLQLGYQQVAVYPGGKKEWSEAGEPVERDSSVTGV